MKPVLKSPVQAEEDVEVSAAVANLESTLYEMKGCRKFRQPFLLGHNGGRGICHLSHRSLNSRPAGSRQYGNCDLATREVLLMSKILVGCDQNGKSALF